MSETNSRNILPWRSNPQYVLPVCWLQWECRRWTAPRQSKVFYDPKTALPGDTDSDSRSTARRTVRTTETSAAHGCICNVTNQFKYIVFTRFEIYSSWNDLFLCFILNASSRYHLAHLMVLPINFVYGNIVSAINLFAWRLTPLTLRLKREPLRKKGKGKQKTA